MKRQPPTGRTATPVGIRPVHRRRKSKRQDPRLPPGAEGRLLRRTIHSAREGGFTVTLEREGGEVKYVGIKSLYGTATRVGP